MILTHLIDIVKVKNSRNNFAGFGGLGPKSRHFLILSATDQKPNTMSLRLFTLLKVSSETIKKW